MEKKTIVVIGAGPGLGNAVAARFGREGYRAALVARRADALEGYVAELSDAGVEAKGYAADVCDIASLDAAIASIQLVERGIFVGTVMVCGVIGGDEHFAPANIAERFWEMAASRADVELRYE